MIEVTKKGYKPVQLKDELLPALCLEICGGGYTPSSVANAMILQGKVNETGTASYKGVTLRRIEQ